MYTSDKRLCLDASGEKVVDCESAEAATLLVAQGGQLSDTQASKYGLTDEPKSDAKAVSEPPANKARASAPENKGR